MLSFLTQLVDSKPLVDISENYVEVIRLSSKSRMTGK
jgi:hypothetical protein